MIAGEQIAGPKVRAACRRHLRDLENGHLRGLKFDLNRVFDAIDFFEVVLKLNGGEFEGIPFLLQPWQAFIVGSLFGWVDDYGHRRFRVAYIEIGKGNGKSPLAAGIGLYCLTADNEPRAEIYAAASKKDQAMVLFRDVIAMVNQSPDLHSRLIPIGGVHPWNLVYPTLNSFFRAISSDDGQSGPRPHCSLIDEVHEHKDDTVVNMLKAGQKGRRQPLTVEITNSGFDRQSVCYQHHTYSDRVVQAEPGDDDFNDEWFAYVCGLDKDEDPFVDESCWVKANPNLGVSVTLKYLRGEVREARGMPSKGSKVKRLNFCQWVGAENPWIGPELWLAAEDEFDPIEELNKFDEVVGALDLSGTRDLTALTLAGCMKGEPVEIEEVDESGNQLQVLKSTDDYTTYTEFWTPKDTLDERRKRDKVDYDTWVEQGHLHATPGRNVDYSYVAQRMVELQVQIPSFRRCCFDPYRIKYLERELALVNCEIELVPHAQGYRKADDEKVQEHNKNLKPGQKPRTAMWMPRSVELLESAVADGRLRVLRNPCLTYCSASAVLVPDPKDNRIFDKRKSRGRIDGIVTNAMAIGFLAEDPPKPKKKQFRLLTLG